MTNTNAASGKKGETLLRDTISEHPDVIETLRTAYRIPAGFTGTMRTSTGQKCDVKIDFDGRNIDASVKSYKKSGSNQIARWSVDNFAKEFGLSDTIREELRELILAKIRSDSELPLFPQSKQELFKEIFEPLLTDIIKKSFSDVPGREILVLYNSTEGMMRIWRMADVVRRIPKTMVYTRQGNIVIGKCVGLQRKGGNGKHVKVPKTSPEHPGNGVQTKLYIQKFIRLHGQRMLAEYQV
jgi:hypothetical protein